MYNKVIAFIALLFSAVFLRPIPALCQKLQDDTLKNKGFYFNAVGLSICGKESSIPATCRSWGDGFNITLVDSTNKSVPPKVSFSIRPEGDFDIPSESQNKYMVIKIENYEYVAKLDKNNRILYIKPYLLVSGRYKLDGSTCIFESKGSSKLESTQYYRKGILVNPSNTTNKTSPGKAKLIKKEGNKKAERGYK